MVLPTPQVDQAGALFCYALTESAWVVGGAVSNGGVVIRWAGEALAPDLSAAPGAVVDVALLDLAATVEPGSDGLVMVPYLLAERSPLWDPDLPGAYLGLRRGHTRAHLVRAAVEGVCRQLAVITDQLDRLTTVTSVRATGGVFRSALWREVMAAHLDRPLRVVAAAEGTALGAAALGLLALGRADELDDALRQLNPRQAATSQSIEPDPGLVETYQRLRGDLPRLITALEATASLFNAATAHPDPQPDLPEPSLEWPHGAHRSAAARRP